MVVVVVLFCPSFAEVVEFLTRVLTPFVFRYKPTHWAPFVFWVIAQSLAQNKLDHGISGAESLELFACVAIGVIPVAASCYV
jgi:hypothetical protein